MNPLNPASPASPLWNDSTATETSTREHCLSRDTTPSSCSYGSGSSSDSGSSSYD
jgi:hypothetical protein